MSAQRGDAEAIAAFDRTVGAALASVLEHVCLGGTLAAGTLEDCIHCD